MAYDEEMADRVRAVLAGGVVTERRMFGGLAFLLGGRMGVAVSTRGVMVRVDPAELETLLQDPGVEQVEMGARTMSGWLRVPGEALDDDRVLQRWVQRGVDQVRSL